ncbi:FadR family transcriptional regulator [Pseudoclavibacter sp. RFBG4]|uniref:FadR/GntR family transcriptional regulator n=1 Tax=Pseudoclavibacter sp. RFBG4 TaxID=2080575 RepID=UPI000CE8E350|nr:FadR/GntR family transcriptional regulator [Pseudoclavibacter sp. RFBG4]PPG30266.1 FadR family transcriptional regulator [Pseudoclavibacter sp. RFBG4]
MTDTTDRSLGPLPRTRALIADDIVLHLERLIVGGDLEPGAPLPPERTLALELGVSRNALREALTRLEGLGLLERRHGSANRVSRAIPLTATLAGRLQAVQADYDHSAEFRALVEPRIARLAAERIDREQLTTLGELLARSADETDADLSARLDIAFHTAIAQATANPLLATLGELTASWTVEARVLSHLEGEGRRVSHEGHSRIFAALSARDSEAAEYAMRIHLSEIRDVIEQARSEESPTSTHTEAGVQHSNSGPTNPRPSKS